MTQDCDVQQLKNPWSSGSFPRLERCACTSPPHGCVLQLKFAPLTDPLRPPPRLGQSAAFISVIQHAAHSDFLLQQLKTKSIRLKPQQPRGRGFLPMCWRGTFTHCPPPQCPHSHNPAVSRLIKYANESWEQTVLSAPTHHPPQLKPHVSTRPPSWKTTQTPLPGVLLLLLQNKSLLFTLRLVYNNTTWQSPSVHRFLS